MIVAVMADIHSNLHALEAVVARIEELRPDKVVCAGDIVGYGARPNECCSIVQKTSDLTVYGNHEIAALTGDVIWMNPHAAKAAIWTSRTLNQGSRSFLSQLGLEGRLRCGERLLAMYHGSVDSAIEYVYEDQLHVGLLEKAKCDILVLGHTHVPYVRKLGEGLAVNPGSVGQPRDRDPRASLAVLDTDTRECVIERVAYDAHAACQDILDAGLPTFLAERLLMGR
ncbi:MAG: metallophosphoesterase family protein [Candidatus Thermoplasmatota archaeon]|nr:metallophosphoesterase family protein [Candidatus Thermoplasmatota archaeon]